MVVTQLVYKRQPRKQKAAGCSMERRDGSEMPRLVMWSFGPETQVMETVFRHLLLKKGQLASTLWKWKGRWPCVSLKTLTSHLTIALFQTVTSSPTRRTSQQAPIRSLSHLVSWLHGWLPVYQLVPMKQHSSTVFKECSLVALLLNSSLSKKDCQECLLTVNSWIRTLLDYHNKWMQARPQLDKSLVPRLTALDLAEKWLLWPGKYVVETALSLNTMWSRRWMTWKSCTPMKELTTSIC